MQLAWQQALLASDWGSISMDADLLAGAGAQLQQTPLFKASPRLVPGPAHNRGQCQHCASLCPWCQACARIAARNARRHLQQLLPACACLLPGCPQAVCVAHSSGALGFGSAVRDSAPLQQLQAWLEQWTAGDARAQGFVMQAVQLAVQASEALGST